MKKIYILLWMLLGFVGLGSAQSNLQFSKVLTYAGTSNSSNYTVPSGMVWKIESATMSNYSGSGMKMLLNNTTLLLVPSGAYNVALNGPFWLKAGDIISVDLGTNLSAVNHYAMSIVEFKIVP